MSHHNKRRVLATSLAKGEGGKKVVIAHEAELAYLSVEASAIFFWDILKFSHEHSALDLSVVALDPSVQQINFNQVAPV